MTSMAIVATTGAERSSAHAFNWLRMTPLNWPGAATAFPDHPPSSMRTRSDGTLPAVKSATFWDQ